MKALSHARLMDEVYARQRHIYDITRKYYLLGRDRAIDALDAAPGQSVLEVGCGTGRNLIIAAKRYPQAQLFGIDISAEMLATADANIRKAGLENRITLARADAARFDGETLFGITEFDRILMSYTVSMIPPWEQAIHCSTSVLSKDGKLVLVDFWNQNGLPQWSKTILGKWLKLFHVNPRETLENTLQKIADTHGKSASFTPLYKGYACIGTIG